MKRILALGVMTAILISLLAGCQPKDTTPTSFATLPIMTEAPLHTLAVVTDTEAVSTAAETTPVIISDADFVEYTNSTYQLSMSVPKGYEVAESDLNHVRFQNSNMDQTSITILAAVGNTLGVCDEREIKNLYWLRSSLLRLSADGNEYELYESSIKQVLDPIEMGDVTFYHDEIAADYYDSKSMSLLIQPYTNTYYFYIDKNAYILNITCPPEDKDTWDQIALQMLSSIKKAEPATIEFTEDAISTFQSETQGIAFAYPKDCAYISGGDRIVFRKNTDPSDPMFGIQITIYLSSPAFTDKNKAPEQLTAVIGASYAADEPLTKIDNVAVKNKVLATGTAALPGNQECPYFDIMTTVVAGKGGLGDFVDGGNIESRLYAFTTAKGNVCAINVSYPASGKEVAASVMNLLETTLVIS